MINGQWLMLTGAKKKDELIKAKENEKQSEEEDEK